MVPRKEVKDILKEYGLKMEGKISQTNSIEKINYSKDYIKFKNEMAPDLSRYERWCKSFGSIIKLNVSQKDANKIRKDLEIAHLDLEPWQPLTLSVMVFLSVFFIGLVTSIAIFLINGTIQVMLFILMTTLALFLFYFTNRFPARLANSLRRIF